MAEDWAGVAAEVEDAIRSVGSTDDGYPATLRKAGIEPVNPWDDPAGDPTYHTVRVLVTDREVRDINGTLIGQTKRTITISGAAGVVPSDDDRIILGQSLAFVDSATDEGLPWQEIEAVRVLAPAGTAVLYDIDLVT